MTALPSPEAVPSRIFKVGLTVPSHDHVSYCVGLGVGPSEDAFREWLHRRMLLSKLPFLWAQVEPVQLHSGGELERLMHLLAYAGGCSPFRQVFWSGEDMTLPDLSESFLQNVAAGETAVPRGACALLLAGKAVADLKLAGPVHSSLPERNEGKAAEPSRSPGSRAGARPREELTVGAALVAMLAAMRRKFAMLWL